MTALDVLGLWIVISIPSALFLVLPAIAVYFYAKRFGPAAGALSALLGLFLLSAVPIFALAPMPKWWTVNWVTEASAELPGVGWREAGYSPSAIDRPSWEPLSFIQGAEENRAAYPSFESPAAAIVPPSQRAGLRWGMTWEQSTRLIGILLVLGWTLALVRFAQGLRAVARFRAKDVEIADPMAMTLARSIADQLGFPGPIRLSSSNSVDSAATVGWLEPVILLPAHWQSWTRDEQRVVLAHEIGHIARRDYLAWVLAQFTLAVHFYHPLAHWLISRLRRDQELAADLLGSELCGGRQKYFVTLSQLVLRQSTRAAPRFSRPVFSARGTFLWRMRMLHAKNLTASSRLRSAHISLLIMLSLLIGLGSAGVGISFADQPGSGSNASQAGAVERGKIMGRFTAADTGKPVKGAKVRIWVMAAQGFPWMLDLISDNDGRYAHDLPLGHCQLTWVLPAPGYYLQERIPPENLALTNKDKIIVRDFSVQPGAPWKIELAGYTGSKGSQVTIGAQRESEKEEVPQLSEEIGAEANDHGDATLTIPSAGGHYKSQCYQSEPLFPFEIPSFELKMEAGFDPTQIQGDPDASAADGSIRLKDRAGRIATVIGAEAFNRDGHALVRLACKPIPKAPAFKIEGTVQTEKGEPIKGAKVTAAVSYTMKNMNRLACMTHFHAFSRDDGKFTIPDVLLNSNDFREDQQIAVVVEKSGFDGFETEKLSVIDFQENKCADFGTIKLKAGKTVSGKIVDENGNPVHGALVNCSSGIFFYRYLCCRSDAQGRFQFPDLSYGKVNFYASYGEQSGSEGFEFDEKSGEFVVSLRPFFKRANPAPVAPQALK